MSTTELTEEQRAEAFEYRAGQIRAAHAELGACETAEQVRDVWSRFYLTLGHRILGRMLGGQWSIDDLIGVHKVRGKQAEAA